MADPSKKPAPKRKPPAKPKPKPAGAQTPKRKPPAKPKPAAKAPKPAPAKKAPKSPPLVAVFSASAAAQLKELAELRERAARAGDASELLGLQFALVEDLITAIDGQKAEAGFASAALYRELRTLESDIVRVIEAREDLAGAGDATDRLAELLGIEPK